MREVIRSFVHDSSKVYFVSNGVILSERIAGMPLAVYDNLEYTDENVGWCDENTALMFCDDKVYRVSYEMYRRMLYDDDTRVVNSGCETEATIIKYDGARYSDTFLQATLDYKNVEVENAG